MSNDNVFNRVPDAFVAKQRSSALFRVLGSLIGWGVFFLIALGALGFWAWGIFTADGPLQQSKTITLPDGASAAEISYLLEKEGVISDARVMNAASIVNRFRGGSLKPGEYEFAEGMAMSRVLSIVSSGKVLTYKLPIPEGWTTQMAVARINENDVLTGDPIDPASLAEGVLVADTQVFRRGMTRAKLVEDMKAAQAKLVDEVWAKRPSDSPLKTKEELVTLASIVEKETGRPEERARVAAVFLNRLKQGMRLQSDPTIIYGIVGGVGKLDRQISRADIDGKTAYNTYQIDGLPPGPIATPGYASLEAVVAPLDTKEVFFVADGTGGHAFAETLEQHNENVRKWREGQKNGIQLPGQEEAAIEPEATSAVQTPLPEVTVAEPVTEPPVAAAAENAQATQPVPQPTTEPPVATAPAVEPAPAPAVEPAPTPAPTQTAAVAPEPEPQAQPVRVKLKPGSIVKVGDKMVPIPVLKRAKP